MVNSGQGARSIRRIFLLALAIRVAVIPFLISDTLNPARDHWTFGSEEGRIARSIAVGEGFSSPLFGHTGPTAWTTPVYPYLLAGVFRLFGIYTPRAAWAILTLNALFSALTCVPVYFIAQRSFGQTAALWAAWTWALHPYAIYFSAEYVWGYCLDALMLALVLCCTIAIEEETSLRRWIAYGFLWGVAALTNAVILSTLPFLLGWLAWRRHRSGIPWRYCTVTTILTLVLTVTPWFVRNYVTFGRFVPFRGTFWLIFWEGNTGDVSELYPDWADPSTNDAELEKYRRLGELGYIEEKRLASFDFVGHHPGLFVWLTARRFVFTWTGVWSWRSDYLAAEPFAIPNVVFCSILTLLALAGLRRAYQINMQTIAPSALVLFSYPSMYYITHPGMEYRHSIDPVLTVFIGVLGSTLSLRRTGEPAREIPETVTRRYD
jgi:4-amino-4-deoxy-L-arabinose transferase-like glycosyltransferase